ncbi:hypothetical protein [Cellulomonas sp. Y8]|uniref:hypothetical protein n=1 Tax=Cellulomonas sp. Y8 TaxID=2591145 RepID=UPI0011CB88E2|nr:hypothetical protein [Cellulomonas sp. Y8]
MSGEAGWNALLAESERLRARARARVRSAVTGLPLFVLVMGLGLLMPRDPYGRQINRHVGMELDLVNLAVFALWGIAPACMARWPRSGGRRGWRWGALAGQPALAVVWFAVSVAMHDALWITHQGWVSRLQQWVGFDEQVNAVLRDRMALAVLALLIAAAVWEVVAVERDVRRLDALGGVPDCPRCRGPACVTWCAGR